MNEKLLQLVYGKMKTSASYDDFKKDFQSNPELQRLAYGKLKTSASFEDFQRDALGGGEVKKKDVPQAPQMPSSTGGVAQEPNVTSAASLIGGVDPSQMTAPIQEDVVSQSSVGNVTSPTALPNQPIEIAGQENVVSVAPVMGTSDIIRESQKVPTEQVDQLQQMAMPQEYTEGYMGGQQIDPNKIITQGVESFEFENSDLKNELNKKVQEVQNVIKQNYTNEDLVEGKHEELGVNEINKFLEENKDEIPEEIANKYRENAANLFSNITDQKNQEKRQERITRNLDNEAYNLSDLNFDGFEQFNEQYNSGELKNSDIIWNDELWRNNPQKVLELYKNLTGEDYSTGNEYDDLNFNKRAKGAIDEIREYSLQNNRRSIDKKIIDLAYSTGNEDNVQQFVDDYKSDLISQSIGYEPIVEKYNSLKEYYRLVNKPDKNEADNKKISELLSKIDQNTDDVYYDLQSQDWVNKRNDIQGLQSQNWNKFKQEIANTYTGRNAMSNLFKDIEKVSAEIEYLKPILENQKGATKIIQKEAPGQLIQQEVSYDQFSKPEIEGKIGELKGRLNAMIEILVENKNPSKNPEANFFDALFQTDAIKEQERNRKRLREYNRLGGEYTEQDIEYLEDDFNKKLGDVVRESTPLAAEIMLDIAIGTKVKGIVGISKLADRLYRGNKFKKGLATVLDKGFDIVNQEVAFQSAGEGMGAGTGEYVFENAAEKLMPKGWNKVSKLVARTLAGTTGETLAEYGGQFTSELIESGDVNKAWDVTTKDGWEGLGLTLASSFLMSGAPATLNVLGESKEIEGINEGNVLKIKDQLEKQGEKSEVTEDFIRTVEETYPEEVISAQGKKLFVDENIEAYSEIVEKPVNEWTDDEVTFVNAMDGFYETSKDLLPEGQVEMFELYKDKFDKRGEQTEIQFPEETKTKEDAVQKQSAEGVDVRQQPKDGETVVDEDTKVEEPTKEGEEVQVEEEIVEPVTADVTNLKSEVDNVAEGMNPMAQKKVFDALTDYTEQVATETNLKGGKLIDEVANRIDQNEELNLTKDDILESKDELVDIIKQKQKQNERIRNQKIDDTQKKEGSKERVQLEEQRSEGKADNGKTEGPKRQRIPSKKQEVIQETEEQLTSPPPAKETGEASVDVERIKKVGKTFADNIRKAKIPNELGNIKSSVGIDVAWNTAVEATARAVETGATIVQAVSNGVSKLKESDWYKSLSEEGKAQAESFVTNKLNEEYKNAEKKIVEETKEETPPPKPPKKESKKKEGSPRERRKQFLNRAKNDPTRDDATKRFLAEVDEMYEVESNKWANSDADRLMDLYEEQNALDQLIEDVKNGEDMSSSVQSMLAQKLVRKLESLERFEEAADMDLWIDEQGRKSGRFIQALSESSNPDSVKRAKTIEWKKQKDSAMQEKASNGIDTNEEIVNDSYKTSKSSVDNFKNNISENSEVNKAIKNVSEGAVKKAKKKQSNARKNINKEKAYRNKLKEDFKKNRGNYLSMSATGLSSSGIEYAGNIAASYVRQGVYNVAEIINNVKEFFKEELEYELTDDDVKKVAGKIVQDEKIVKENLDVELRKIIKEHFNDRNKYGKELSQKFIDEAGLTNAEAKYLQDKVMESFEKALKSEMENEVRRMFQRAKKNGTPKKVKTFTERVIDAYRFGALTNEKYSDQFGEYFGFVSLTNEDKVQIAKLAKAFESIPEGSLEQLKKMGEFTHYLNNLEKRGFKYKFYESLKYMHEMWYTSILSGLSTSYRGAKGILQTGVSDLFVEALKNPGLFFSPLYTKNSFFSGLKQLNYGLDKGRTAFLEILKTGYNPMDKAQELEISPTKLNELINNKQKGWKSVEKAFYYLPAKMVRILVASDALVKMTTKDLFAYTKTYNNLLNEGANRKTKKFWSDLADRMHNSQAEFDIAMETAKGEKKAMEEAGVNTKGFNLRNRANEIIEERRDISAREYSTYKAEKAGLNQTPQGLIGVLYKKIVEASQTVPLIQLVVPFTKIPSNQVSLWLDWSPWGFKRAAFGYGTGVRKSKIAKKYGEKEVEAMRLGVSSMSADERVELMIKAVLGTAAWGALFWQLGLDDDDEYKMIDASYNGFGDFKKNEGLRKNNWRPYSVRFRLPGGEWSDYIEYRDSPLGFVFASISSVSDQLKYQKEDEGSLTKKDTEILIYGGMLNSLMFVKEQNYMKGISDFMDVFNVNYGSDAEGVLKQLGSKGVKFLYDTPTQYFKSILYPNIYKQVYGTYKAYSGKPQNIKARFGEDTPLYMWQSLLSDIPYLEDLESANLGQMFDDLGNPIVRRVRDTAPWISLIWSEDYVDMQRQSGEYDNYKMLNSKGLSAGGIYIPKSINGVKDIDPLDKVKVSKKQAELMNEFITKHFDKIKGMSKIEAQEFISKGYEKNKKRSIKVIKDKYK